MYNNFNNNNNNHYYSLQTQTTIYFVFFARLQKAEHQQLNYNVFVSDVYLYNEIAQIILSRVTILNCINLVAKNHSLVFLVPIYYNNLIINHDHPLGVEVIPYEQLKTIKQVKCAFSIKASNQFIRKQKEQNIQIILTVKKNFWAELNCIIDFWKNLMKF